MDLKKHFGRGALLLAALVLVGSAAGRLLFASADTGGYFGSIENDTVYGRVSPTSTSMVYYRSASPTSTGVYAARSGDENVSVVSVVSNRFTGNEGVAVVRSATPTSTRSVQTLSAGYYDWSETYIQSEETPAISTTENAMQSSLSAVNLEPPAAEVITPVYTPVSVSAAQVSLTINTAVDTNAGSDNFTYDLEYMGASGNNTVAPSLPLSMSATSGGGGLASFADIEFSEAGQYYFRVSQNQENNAYNVGQGYEWNDSWYFVGVLVEEVNGVLVPTVSYYEMSDGGVCIPRGTNAFFTQIHAY